MENRSKSRRQTPWDGEKDVTATQEFLRTHYHARYEERHPALRDAGETALINAHRPACCPYCGSGNFISKGYDSLGVQRYVIKWAYKAEVRLKALHIHDMRGTLYCFDFQEEALRQICGPSVNIQRIDFEKFEQVI